MRSEFVAASTRTSAINERDDPIARYSPFCKNRSNLTWPVWLKASISSRKSVPPSASPMSPFSADEASVNAPFACPKSSFSMKQRGHEAKGSGSLLAFAEYLALDEPNAFLSLSSISSVNMQNSPRRSFLNPMPHQFRCVCALLIPDSNTSPSTALHSLPRAAFCDDPPRPCRTPSPLPLPLRRSLTRILLRIRLVFVHFHPIV